VRRNVGLAHLSALHLAPPQLIEQAAARGFDFVGVRVHPATEGEQRYPLSAGSALSEETVRSLRARNISVRDVEVLTLDGTRQRDHWLPLLGAGAALGAQVLNVIGGDADRARLLDTLGQLVEDARKFGIIPSLEPISYQAVRTVADAGKLAEQTGCGLMLDVLHFVRAGCVLDDLSAVPPGAVKVIQLCDGPASTPPLTPPTRLPLSQSVDGSALQLESRSKRLVPGTGTFPLLKILRALPGVPVSIEVPDVEFVDKYGTEAHLDRLARASELIAEADAQEETRVAQEGAR
jgi:sugar phosphate isomerase/epimerase